MILSINTDPATIGRFKKLVLDENVRRSDASFEETGNGNYKRLTNGDAINMLIDSYERNNCEPYEPGEYDGKETGLLP